MSFSEVLKIKDPNLRLMAAMALSAFFTWNAVSWIHAEKFLIYDDLEKKYLEQKNELQAMKNEVLSLRKELEIASGKATKDKTTRLQALIKQIDNQIRYKKEVLSREARSIVGAPQSDDYRRTEKEIDSLLSRRDQAQMQMIEVNAQ